MREKDLERAERVLPEEVEEGERTSLLQRRRR